MIMAADNMVKFVRGDAASFALLEEKDANTLYFIVDEKRIYLSDTCLTGGQFAAVASLPEKGELNTLYVNTTDGSVSYWNGTAYQTVVKATSTSISGAGDDLHFATTKAIVNYVTTKINDLDASAVVNRISALETKMNTVQGEGEGSIKKALSDAKAYTDALASGQVATNKADIASLKSGKADKATTLAGYGITDAYTKTEADSKIASAVANAGHLKRQIVEELPGTGDEHTIYMVKKAAKAGESQNAYNEYMWIEGKFELIGDSAVDLTDYATKTEVATAKSQAVSEAKTYSDSLAKNYATAAQGTKADSALQQADVVEGTTNGAISVKGSAVKVHGLGSAAYTDSGAYATAAQGTKADSAVQKAQITSGSANGTIAVQGTDVAVKGLGSAAYVATTAFDAAGTAQTKADAALASAKQFTTQALTWTEL